METQLVGQKRRMIWMLAVTCVAFVVALGGVVSYAALHAPWGLPLFALAITVGVGAQVWFIVGVARVGVSEKAD